MKKFLITTALSIATTAAFGAASVRTPQLGGATVTPAATTNTARAGTMRAQTMKTSSVSTPAPVTTTQSIATPVSTETTDARIALLKGIKGFNPSKIKDTTTATSELNSLNDRIEELTAQLDRAEAAQSSVITEANIDAKITEKLTALGTSTGIKETYSKEEVDALLNDIKKKLPTFNDKGNMTWTDPNGNLVAVPYHWINLVNQQEHLLLTFTQGQGWTGSYPIADIFTYQTNKTNDEIATFLSTHTCKGETSTWCIITNTTALDNGIKEIDVLRLRHGSWKIAEHPEYFGYISEDYYTFEDSPKEYIKNMVCGDRPENECNVNQYYTRSDDSLGEFNNVPGQIQEATSVRIYKLVRYYMDYALKNAIDFIGPNWERVNVGSMLEYNTNLTTEEIEEYVSSVICSDATSGSGWCGIDHTQQESAFGVPWTQVSVYRLDHGYKPGWVDYTINNLRTQNFVTMEDDGEQYILDHVCGERPSTECHLAPGYQTSCSNLGSLYNITREACVVYIEQTIE